MLNFAVLVLAICAIALTATYAAVMWAELQTLRTKRVILAFVANTVVESIAQAQQKEEHCDCDFCNEVPELFKLGHQ